MDGRSRPYFFGVDQALNFQQKEALAQGIQQVVDTTPEGFGAFEFQFTGHQVYIYKLQHGIILLVLTGDRLDPKDYHPMISQLQGELQKDAANAIATFRLMAGNITLTSQNQWMTKTGIPEAAVPSSDPVVSPPPSSSYVQNGNAGRSSQDTPVASPSPTPVVSQPPAVVPSALSTKEVVAALNQISQVATHYLGNIVVANYWKSSRPSVEWLGQFQSDRSAQFTFKPATATDIPPLDAEQEGWIREWIAAFVSRCSKVIRDFQEILHQSDLDERQKALLPPP